MNCPESLDPEMKNIIDKLANFVARNGPQFEEMTKQKQKDNPKFSFLFGGEFYTYYKFRVASEIAQLNQKQHLEQQQQQQAVAQQVVLQPLIPSRQWQANPQLQEQIAQAQSQVTQLQTHIQDQVSQSENNLAAQYQMLMQQQQSQIQETIVKSLEDKLDSLLHECELTLEDFNEAVHPIIESCTKDAILAGKNWIMQRTSSEKFCDALAQYFLKRITSKDAPFQLRLHLIYLINDVMHHCVRRSVETLRRALETVVVPIFCTSSLSADEDKIEKLNKLLDLWEKNKYFGPETIELMKDPSQALSSYQANLITENAQAVTAITQTIQQQYTTLEKQHQVFVNHLNLQLATAQQQLQVLVSQGGDSSIPPGPNSGVPGALLSFPPPNNIVVAGGNDQLPPYNQNGGMYGGIQHQPQQPQQFEYNHGSNMALLPPDMQGPPPGGSGMMPLPDFSKPPPGFPPLGPPLPGMPPLLPPDSLDLTPSVPYYDLPAGLIAPLIRLEDFEYKPLDPKDIRLPPPMPPSERLLAAVEAFYLLPSRERPRDVDGWEKLGLYEFFRAKQRARRIKDRGWDSRSQSGSRSRSGSPGHQENSPPRRRFNSEERRQRSLSQSRSPSPSRSRSGSGSGSSSRSKSPSTSPRRRSARSKSRSRSKSPLPYLRSSHSPSPITGNRRSLSPVNAIRRSRSPVNANRRSRSPVNASRRSRSPMNAGRRSRSPMNASRRSRSPMNANRRSRSPVNANRRSRSPVNSNRRSRSPVNPNRRSRSPVNSNRRPQSDGRSPTPPSFMSAYGPPPPDSRLGEENKGHQLLRKMGWGGRGLGAEEQGMTDPVEAADVRDRMDMHKGIGIDLRDPFEQFRKNKSQGFIQRMKTRDDERPKKKSRFND